MNERLVATGNTCEEEETMPPLTMLLAEPVEGVRPSAEDDDGFTYDTTGTVADVRWDSG